MSWTINLINVWLPFYLSKRLGASSSSLSYTAVPYLINSISSIGFGHLADSLVLRNWSVLAVRRLMTAIGLIGSAMFLIIFMTVDNLGIAIL